jgi:hypothetical protein
MLEVIAKSKHYTGLCQADPELVGHIMVQAREAAERMGLSQGYRIVVD